jgi:antitoxin MazE
MTGLSPPRELSGFLSRQSSSSPLGAVTSPTSPLKLHELYFKRVYRRGRTQTRRVAKWGNSLAVRLPQAVVEALKLKEGDEIEITITGDRHFRVARNKNRKKALGRLRKYRDRLPAGFKFDRGEAHARR